LEAHFFVYGTLKRGQCREHCWPVVPVAVQPALTRGQLYDTGPYPAMIEGDDWVVGELWSFHLTDQTTIARVLDVIEEYDEQSPDNLYVRKLVTCWTLDAVETIASTYIYARRRDLATLRRIDPIHLIQGKLCSQWPK
jgi:gamma-glutamylcyclotransferase (GGCT)/AIG2-like uncharacterized protein YtfP